MPRVPSKEKGVIQQHILVLLGFDGQPRHGLLPKIVSDLTKRKMPAIMPMKRKNSNRMSLSAIE